MYTAILYFEHHNGIDDLHIKGDSLDELRAIADKEVIRRKPEALLVVKCVEKRQTDQARVQLRQ